MKQLLITTALMVFSASLFSQGNITINISDLKSNKGQVVVILYVQGQAFGDFEEYFKKEIQNPIVQNTATITINNLPDGEYSFVVFHDENNDAKLEKAWYGMPLEGIANSGNHTKRPNYENTKFTILKGDKVFNLKIKYL